MNNLPVNIPCLFLRIAMPLTMLFSDSLYIGHFTPHKINLQYTPSEIVEK